MSKIMTSLFGDLQFLEFQPEVPIRETFEWLTGINESENGTEERSQLRTLPRRFFDYTIPLNLLKKNSAFNALYGQILSDWAVPLWSEGQFLGILSSGSSSVTCNVLDYDLQAETLAFVFESNSNWEVVEITTIGASSISLDGTLVNSYANAFIFPVKRGFLKDSISLKSNAFENSIKLTFQLEETTDYPTASSPDRYQDFDIYHEPGLLQSGSISKKVSTRVDYNDFQTGAVSRYTPWKNARVSSFYNFQLETQEEVNDFKTWLFRRGGKYLSFWLPTFESDLRVKSTGAITTQLLVESDALIDSGESRVNISILKSDSTWADCQIIDFEQVTSETVRLTLDTDISLDASEIVQVSWLGLNRFDADSINLEWIGNNLVNVSIPILEIEAGTPLLSYLDQEVVSMLTVDSTALSSYQLNAIFNDGQIHNDLPLWTSSDSNVLTVNSSGFCAPVSPGTATIQGRYRGVTSSCEFTVYATLPSDTELVALPGGQPSLVYFYSSTATADYIGSFRHKTKFISVPGSTYLPQGAPYPVSPGFILNFDTGYLDFVWVDTDTHHCRYRVDGYTASSSSLIGKIATAEILSATDFRNPPPYTKIRYLLDSAAQTISSGGYTSNPVISTRFLQWRGYTTTNELIYRGVLNRNLSTFAEQDDNSNCDFSFSQKCFVKYRDTATRTGLVKLPNFGLWGSTLDLSASNVPAAWFGP